MCTNFDRVQRALVFEMILILRIYTVLNEISTEEDNRQ